MSDDSDIQHPKKSKYKVRYLDESSNSSDSSLEAVVRKKPGISSKTNRIPDSDSDSDSSIDYIRKRKRIGVCILSKNDGKISFCLFSES